MKRAPVGAVEARVVTCQSRKKRSTGYMALIAYHKVCWGLPSNLHHQLLACSGAAGRPLLAGQQQRIAPVGAMETRVVHADRAPVARRRQLRVVGAQRPRDGRGRGPLQA